MPTNDFKTVGDVMTRKIATLAEDDVIANIDEAMHHLRVRHVPVVDRSNKLVGLLSHADLLHPAANFLADRDGASRALINQFPVGQLMQREVLTVEAGDSLVEAGRLMWDSKVGCLPVVDPDGKLVGIITEADFIAVALELLGSEIKKSDVEELARTPRKARVPLAM